MKPTYQNCTDEELLKECDQHYANPLITELARRLEEKMDALRAATKD